MNNPPFSSEFINVYNSQISPSTLHTKNNALEYSCDVKNLRIRFYKEYQARIFELEFEE